MDDVTAVLDACGSARTVLSAEVEGAMLAVIYAATYPDRVSHLVLTHPMARLTERPRLRLDLGGRRGAPARVHDAAARPLGHGGERARWPPR